MSSIPSSPITISSARIAQLHKVMQAFIAGFLQPLDTSSPAAAAAFTATYHPDIQWFDHAFLIQRQGHDAVIGLQKAFTHCNQPFHTTIKAIILTERGCAMEQVWSGRCSNDIVRPNGEVAVKASGREFKCHVCMLFEIGEDGKIRRIDEYYNRRWDEGVVEEEYKVVKMASMKTDEKL